MQHIEWGNKRSSCNRKSNVILRPLEQLNSIWASIKYSADSHGTESSYDYGSKPALSLEDSEALVVVKEIWVFFYFRGDFIA